MAGDASSSSLDVRTFPSFILSRVRLYRELGKSGIVTLVLISVFGGYLIGHPFDRSMDGWHLLETLLGILLLATGSSSLNQIQDRQMDSQMKRTQSRPLPSGKMSLSEAKIFTIFCLITGIGLLAILDLRIMGLGLMALFFYNVLYTLWWKRRWAFAAIPGAIPGALPILMGYAAASGQILAPGGLFLFFILFFWQMPHFWVLAIKYRQDYEQGGVPTLPVVLGETVTVLQIELWSLGYVGLSMLAPLFLSTGPFYLVVAFLTGIKVLWEQRKFIKSPNSSRWLAFFLWVNFSLVIYIFAAVVDLWSFYFLIPYITG